MQDFSRILIALVLVFMLGAAVFAIDEDTAPAVIVNDEGGPVVIRGEINYTNSFFTAGVSEPLVILEDQTGFINRDRHYLFPPESQVLGQITSDFFTSPFTYSLSLPIEPQAPLNDVDQDEVEDTGVMVFQVAYWDNTFGDGFLQERDLFGGGWSGAYCSADVSSDAETLGEYKGGTVLVYSPVEGQGFPSGFGEDGKLFTEDDPIVVIPQGYTIVNMDTEVFTFDRSREVTLDLIEGEGAEADDFSEMSYTEAFDAMLDKFRREYAFTEFKNIDWDALEAEFRPLVEEAEADEDATAFARVIQDFTWSIPDGHVGSNAFNFVVDDFFAQTDGDIGINIRETTDGRFIVNYLRSGSPADEAGIQLGAEVFSFNDTSIADALDATVVWSAPFSTTHNLRLQQLRYVTRFEVGTDVDVSFANPDGEEETVTLTTVNNREAFAASSFNVSTTGTELPVDWELIGDSTFLVRISSFFDDSRLSVLLWERMIRNAQELEITGIIIDMRNNGGGSGWLADQMAAYFFEEPLVTGNTYLWDDGLQEFFFDEENPEHLYLPPEDLRYDGDVVVIVGPNCASACEFFSYDMTLDGRATIIGQYPSAGLGGSVNQFFMPEGIVVQITVGRAVDPDGNIHIEGSGVEPDVVVPVDEDTLGLTDVRYFRNDPVLDAAIAFLGETASGAEVGETIAPTEVEIVDGGEIGYDEEITGDIAVGQRVQYSFTIEANADPVGIYILGDLDTYLRLYDETGAQVLIENDDFMGTTNSGYPGIVLEQTVTIIIEVATYDDASAGEYTLLVSTGDAPFEVNVEDGGAIAVGDTVEGEFVAGTRLSYTLDLAADTVISISLNAPDDLDTYLRVYDADGELIAENDDISSNNHNSALEEFSLEADGTITIEVATYGDSSEGSYELVVEANE